MNKKYNDDFWDFEGSDIKEYTHCFHIYPAMMIPQIAREIIKRYHTKNMKILFDPYCGTGTSLVEGSLAGMSGIGTDLNPLAQLISRVKVTPVNINQIKEYKKDLKSYILDKTQEPYSMPNITNIDYWFKPTQLQDLNIIKQFIDNIKDVNIKSFFLVPFSETVREVSLTRNSEFKLYRMPKEKIEEWNPDTNKLYLEKLNRNIKGYIKYEKDSPNTNQSIYNFNTSYGIPQELIQRNSVDMVITSPPYGDSKTTVAYGQFSTLSNEWLGIEKARQVDNNLMGGKKVDKITKLNYEPLDNIIKEIHETKPQRAKEVVAFYQDYKNSIENVSKVVKLNGIVAYVVGNRRVNNKELPTDEFTKHAFEQNGFKHLETIIRNIPNKRQPSKTSPTNKVGKKVSTMTKEYIIIMKKENA